MLKLDCGAKIGMAYSVVLTIILQHLLNENKKQKQKTNTDIKTHFRIPKTKNKVY